MMVQAQEEIGEGSANPTDSHHTLTNIQPSTSQLQKTKQNRKLRRKVTEVPRNHRDTVAQTRSERVSKIFNDTQLAGVNTPRSESSEDKGLGEEDASKQGRIVDIDSNKDIYLVNVHNDEDMFGVNDLDGDEVIVESVDVIEQAKEVVDDITLAKALMEIKSAKPKADKVVIQEPEHGITTTTPTTITATSSRPKAKGIVIHEQEQVPTPMVSLRQPSHVKDKGKGKMVEPEPVKKLSKKDQLMLDEELAFKLQAKEEEERISREKSQQIKEVNIAWDDVQVKINADYELAQRLQAEEQEELTDAEKEKLFMQFLEKRTKFFTAKRAKEKRDKPPTKAQQRSIMCTYLKNMKGYKLKRLSWCWKVQAEAKVTKGNLKRAGEEFEQENAKKQKIEDDKESAELKQCLEIIPDDGDDVTVDATHVSFNSLTIVDYKIHKEGKQSYF
uniref:Uncharacterized protein n=1 Tax=Tanacetum cinerariifolium TaxID=118510 RepID=A0A6L2LVJ9_TANCI|nr:hypothetical protein [Tanacetum cinerariifolium]